MRLRLGERGVSAVEFAVIAPATLLIIAAIAEFTVQGITAAALDAGAQRASRVGITGGDSTGTLATDKQRTDAVKAAVLAGAGSWLKDENLTVTMSSYATIADVKANSNFSKSPGAAGQLVQYALTYKQPFMLDTIANQFLSKTNLVHTSTVLVKNEPFPSN